MLKLNDAVAVVTGASRGIGRTTAVALARAGAHVVCVARASTAAPGKLPGTVEETARQVEALGRRALAVSCNIARDAEVEEMARRTLDTFGRVDVLINNAAVNVVAPFAKLSMKHWDLIQNVNLRGPVLCTRAFLPAMLAQGGGRIVNVSSGAVTEAVLEIDLGILSYAVSKAGLEMFTRGLGVELRSHAIGVNCLRIETMVASEGAREVNLSVEGIDWQPPETAADAILWLATREPSYTGRVMTMAEVCAAQAAG